MKARVINERQAQILETLAEYQYLTPQQLLKLGVATDYENLRQRYLKPLADGTRPLIKFAEFGFEPGKGRLPRIYYLTKRGVQTLTEYLDIDPASIIYPVGQVQFRRDYHHRVGLIDIRISLNLWAKSVGHEVEFFDTYYDVEGAQRGIGAKLTRKTQVSLPIIENGEAGIKTIVPDANFRLAMDDKSRLFTLELHRSNKTARIVDQLKTHLRLITEELLAEKHQHPHLNYMLSVHEKASTIGHVRAALLADNDFADFLPHFLFATLNDAKDSDFGAIWRAVDGTEISSFPTA